VVAVYVSPVVPTGMSPPSGPVYTGVVLNIRCIARWPMQIAGTCSS
jgi:hypothetical protein